MILKYTFFFQKQIYFKFFNPFSHFQGSRTKLLITKQSNCHCNMEKMNQLVLWKFMRTRTNLKIMLSPDKWWDFEGNLSSTVGQPELQFCFFFSFWQFFSLWFLGCCVVRLKEISPCSSYQRLTCSWRDGRNFWNWQFIDQGPISKKRVLKAHYFPQSKEKSITFSKLQKSNVKTKYPCCYASKPTKK